MTPDQRINRLYSFLKWFVFLFIALSISNKFEHNSAIAVGNKNSPVFAQSLSDELTIVKAQQEKDPKATRQLGNQMMMAKYTVRGITSFVLAFLIVYFRLNTNLQNNSNRET